MSIVEHERFEWWMEKLSSDVRGVNDRLDELNGRTRNVEVKVAVLEDRGVQAVQAAKDPAARYTGVGAAIAAAGALIWKWFQP